MGFEDLSPGFLSTPESQPCVRGVFRAVPGYAVHVGQSCSAWAVSDGLSNRATWKREI